MGAAQRGRRRATCAAQQPGYARTLTSKVLSMPSMLMIAYGTCGTRATRKISSQPIIRRSAWRSSPSRYDTFSSGHPSTAARAPEPTATAWAGGPQRASVGENGGTHLDRGLCGRLDEKAAAVGRHRAGHARRVTSSPALPCAYRRDGTRAHPRLSRTAWVPSSGGAPPECGSRRNAPRPLPTRSLARRLVTAHCLRSAADQENFAWEFRIGIG
jgi:hypothetical protein